MSSIKLQWDRQMTSDQAERYHLTSGFIAIELYRADVKSAAEKVEAAKTNIQQLKAEIAAVANTIIECEAGGVTVDFAALKRHLLRLSAV
jgi:hypothetical protein